MKILNSSWIIGVDYDGGTMILYLKGGRTLTMRGVPERHYRGLVNAWSPGGYYRTYLKGIY